MTPPTFPAVASLLAVALLGAAAQAQQPAPAAGAQPPASQQAPYSGPTEGNPPPEAGGAPAPVWVVTSVEVLRSSRAGGMDVVRVRGTVPSSSWNQPHLLPISQGQPLDGILDLVFQASAPGGASALGPSMAVEAILPVEVNHPYKGVRVRGGSNALTLKTLPGYVEGPAAPKEDCAKCIGKYFVAKGANPPANVAADNIVRETDLAWPLRIIKPTDGIASYVMDPNRLTLVLSDDGRIVDGAWD